MMGYSTLPESLEDTSLGAAVDTLDGGPVPHKSLDRLEKNGLTGTP